MAAQDAGPATMAKQVRILVVDDHPLCRQGLIRMISLEPDLTVCGEASDAPQAIQAARTLRPDLMIVDVTLGDTSGIELVKDIQARFPGLPMLVVSMHDEALYASRALQAGAMGYIMKEEAIDKMLTAIRRVLSGNIYVSERVATRMLQGALSRSGQPVASPVETLSDRELEVFQLMGRGMTTREIAGALHLSVKTVETHRARIKAKVGVTTGPQLLRYAMHWEQSHSQG